MEKILAIYGAGGLGREVLRLAKILNKRKKQWDEFIFVDKKDNPSVINGVHVYTEDHVDCRYKENLEAVIGIGEPSIRESVYQKIKTKDKKIATLIHPDVYIDETVSIGEGTIICENADITCNVNLGHNIYIQPQAVIGHDVSVGSHSVIGTNCHIGGATRIGERVYMGFLSGTKEGLIIGADVICAAGSIVFQNLHDAVIVVGNPARIMKKNKEKKVFK